MFLEYFQRIILITPPVLLALTVHECAHGWVAFRYGDPTAKMLGRVSLNPIRHLDFLGTIALLFSGMFGWAKPVPINPRNFRDPGRAILWVSLAGPLSNLFLAGFFALIYKLFPYVGAEGLGTISEPLFIMVRMSILINVSLAVFNMIPVPPLDGSKVLSNLLPPDKAFAFSRLEPYGFLILLMLLATGIVHRFVSPVVFLTAGILMGGF